MQVNITTPKRMNAKQKELLKEFARAGGETWVGESKEEGFFEKVKKKVTDFIRSMNNSGTIAGNL